MEQFEKVCKGLECCEKDVQLCYGETVCEYYRLSPRCLTTLAHDALTLIRKQQDRIKELEAAIAEWEKFAPFLYAHGMLSEPPKEDQNENHA